MEKNNTSSLHSGKEIISLQNESDNIDLLKAMRKTYAKGKFILGWLFVLNIGVVLGLAFLVWQSNNTKWNEIFAIYGVVMTVLDIFVLTPKMKVHYKKGAMIQEVFDQAVFGLKLNPLKFTDPVDPIEIKQIASTYKDNPKLPLPNWYDTVKADFEPSKAVLSAQTMSPTWERNQKQRWLKIINIVVWSTVAVTFVLLLLENPDFISMLAYVLPAVLPVVVFGYQYKKNLKDDIEAVGRIATYAKSCQPDAFDNFQARQLQDAIFEYRKNSTPIFDWTYKKFREKLEGYFKKV